MQFLVPEESAEFWAPRLARVGEAVTMVVRPAVARGVSGRTAPRKPAGRQLHCSGREIGQPYLPPMCLWIAVKATQLESALNRFPSRRRSAPSCRCRTGSTTYRRLRERFGHDRVIAATIAGEMERIAPGRMVHPSPFLMLNIASSGRELLGGVAEKLDTLHWSCRFVDDEATLLWIKLVFLGPFALSDVGRGRADWRSPRRRALAPATRELRARILRGRDGREGADQRRQGAGGILHRARKTCAAPCRRTSIAAIRLNWMRSAARSCAEASGMGFRSRSRTG